MRSTAVRRGRSRCLRRNGCQQSCQRTLIQVMQKQVGDDDAGPNTRQGLENIAAHHLAIPAQRGKFLVRLPADNIVPVQNQRTNTGPAPGQPPRHAQQKAAVAAAQIGKDFGRGNTGQGIRHDGALAHRGIDPCQIAARTDGARIIGREEIQNLRRQDACGHVYAAIWNIMVSATRPGPKDMAQPRPSPASRMMRSRTNITVPDDMLP